MNGAICEVGDLLRMAERKTAAAAGVTGVGRRTGITLANSVHHSACVHATDETTSAFHEEFAVPTRRRRQPDFGLDFRIGCWPESNGNTTVSCCLFGAGDVGQARHVGTRRLG